MILGMIMIMTMAIMIIVDAMTIVALQPLAGEQGKLSDLQSCCPWKCLFIIRKNVMMMMVEEEEEDDGDDDEYAVKEADIGFR